MEPRGTGSAPGTDQCIWFYVEVFNTLGLKFCTGSSLFSFSFNDLSVGKSGVLKSLSIIVWSLTCNLNFSNVYLTNVSTLAFGG